MEVFQQRKRISFCVEDTVEVLFGDEDILSNFIDIFGYQFL
jgi:hypothetical protein